MLNLKLIGSIGAGALLIGFSGGWTVKGWKVSADHEKALEARDLAHSEAIALQQERYDALLSENLQLAADLDAQSRNVQYVTREIIREVPNAVQPSTPDNDCTLSPALVMLHNRAARGTAADTGDDRPPTSLIPDALSRPERAGDR